MFTLIFSLLILLLRPFGFNASWMMAYAWSKTLLWCLEIFCNIKIEISGKEYLPASPCVVLAKHQSALETIAMPLLIPAYAWVLKRELLWLPVFGWALWAMESIGIKRSHGKKAMQQVLKEGTALLERGRIVVMFPEGTRIAAGQTGRYKVGGILLAKKANMPISLIAHNAGVFWRRRGYIKNAGVVKFQFISGFSADEVQTKKSSILLAEVQERIEGKTRELENSAADKIN
ncbi:MAG: lysophospholipid acyltransferase family protein [Mariprofundales bacterium]